jgi:cation:H+ antiporter
MLLDVARLMGGLVLLYFGAEWLVAGASGLALALGIPQLVVGLTVVAYGTSAPEVVVGIQAALEGHPAVALGNVIGSNIANLGLILGISVLVRPARIDGALRLRELPVLVVSAALVPVMLLNGTVSRLEGALLVALAIAYTGGMIRLARSASAVREAQAAAAATGAAADRAGAPTARTRLRLVSLAIVGLLLLVAGGHFLVGGATGLARVLGLSERLVGLTVVAIGTSLPELATSVVAAMRGHSDIAVGNVVGSNIFNVLLCLGVAACVADVDAPLRTVALDAVVMSGMTFLAVVFMRTERTMRRWEGAVLLAGYVTFLLALVRSAV